MYFFKDTATTEIYTYVHTRSPHDALPICRRCTPPTARRRGWRPRPRPAGASRGPWTAPAGPPPRRRRRSEEHTSELQSLMRISYAVFCLKKKNENIIIQLRQNTLPAITVQSTKSNVEDE